MSYLVIYYSFSGITRAVATALADELGADTEEIHCGRYSPGFWGSVRAAWDSWRGHLPIIEPLAHVPSRYEFVVVGGPIWAFRPATPVRAFLREYTLPGARLAFFLTHGGSAARRSLHEMERLAGRAPIATLVVREADVKNGTFVPAASSFVAALRKMSLAT